MNGDPNLKIKDARELKKPNLDFCLDDIKFHLIFTWFFLTATILLRQKLGPDILTKI